MFVCSFIYSCLFLASLWTAESDVLYSTLDILLDVHLPEPKQTVRNKIYDEIGKKKTNKNKNTHTHTHTL